MVEAGSQLMGRAVGGAGTAEFLLAAHREMGVRVLLDVKPVEIASTATEFVRSVSPTVATSLRRRCSSVSVRNPVPSSLSNSD